MQQNFNEFYPTVTNFKSGMMDLPNFSQNLFEDERSRAPGNYRCSLVDIPEFGDPGSLFGQPRTSDDPQRIEMLKKQRASVVHFSNNSIINLDTFARPTAPLFRPCLQEPSDSVTDLENGFNLKNLWNSRRNLFDIDSCPDPSPAPVQLGLRPTQGSAAHNPLQPKHHNQKLVIAPPSKPARDIKPSVVTTPSKKERVACHCKKSKCLRLYCECFAKGLICGVDCSCDGCHNTEDLKDLRELVVQETLEKNPFAFKSKYKQLTNDQKLLHSRGCNCSKTGCVKKYCECYNAGTGCSRLCKCSNCKNENIELEDAEVKIYYDRVLRKRSKKSVLSECFENKKDIVTRFKRN